MTRSYFTFFILSLLCLSQGQAKSSRADLKYEASWSSLDTRPLPTWYDDAKFGIFIHWGIFSVPSFGSEWFWYFWDQGNQQIVDFMNKNYKPGFSYQDFAPDFTAEFYNPADWADLFKDSGAKYVVLTSKHHEGYTLWPSENAFSWNSVEVGPHRDLVGDLAAAIRNRTDLKFGVYHSLFEWFNPLFLEDKANNYETDNFVKSKSMPELYDLVNRYQPEIVWSDGEGGGVDKYWTSLEFIAWLYNESPVKDSVVVNDRWGVGDNCKHGDFFTCVDHYNPGVLQAHKWENCMTIDSQSWGYRRNAKYSDYISVHKILTELVVTVSCGGNLLLNVGPTKDGIITPIYEERLRQIGEWLKVNGEGIYGTRPWTFQNDTLTTGVWYTKKDEHVYAAVLKWPENRKLELSSPVLSEDSVVTLLGYNEPLEWTTSDQTVTVMFPEKNKVPVEWAWVLKFTNVSN